MTYYADCFGPCLAKVAMDEGAATITPDLKRRADAAWSMPPEALRAVFQRAEALLAQGPDAVTAAYRQL